jgi:hypothetical protein
MYYDPNFALLLGGGGGSNDPCAKRDLLWTWICLGFLLGAIVIVVLIVIVGSILRKSRKEREKKLVNIIQRKEANKQRSLQNPNQLLQHKSSLTSPTF